MDQNAPHNLPFEPDASPVTPPPPPSQTPTMPPPAAPEIPTVQSPVMPPPVVTPPAPAPAPQARFLSGEPPVQAMSSSTATPKQPEDMFADLDASRTRAAMGIPVNDPLTSNTAASYGKYVLWLCCFVAGLGILAGALWYFAIHRPALRAEQEALVPVTAPVTDTVPVTQTPEPAPSEAVVPSGVMEATPENTNVITMPDPVPAMPIQTAPVVTPPAGTNVPPPTSVQTEPEPLPTGEPLVAADSDMDGLSDTREQELGTDPRNADTDSDGLKDGEEVLKYGTNPLASDTDGDTYSDGSEVSKGYNPRGAGTCSKSDCIQ